MLLLRSSRRIPGHLITLFILISTLSSLCSAISSSPSKGSGPERTLAIPASFSSNQKTYKVSVGVDNIVNILAKYELDSHVEVVLLGDFDSQSLGHVSEALDQLSQLAAGGSPLQHAHEKIMFHVTLAKQLETPLTDLLEQYHEDSDEQLQEKVFSILEAYHHKITATRSLFVTHLSEPFFAQTYASSAGYAVLDLFSNRQKYSSGGSGGDIKPIHAQHDTLPAPSFPISSANKELSAQFTHAYDLATDIFRSAEVLFPVPLPDKETLSATSAQDLLFSSSSVSNGNSNSGSTSNNAVPKLPSDPPPTHVHLKLLTICGHPLKQCQPDVISTAVLDSLARESFSSSSSSSSSSITALTITHSSSILRISNSVPLMSAVLASCQRFSAPQNNSSSNSGSQVVYFSPEELLSHIAHVPEVTDLLAHTLLAVNAKQTSSSSSSTSTVNVLPIISILLPDDWEGLLTIDNHATWGRNANQKRFCGRGLFDYGPNMTRYGTTISCHAFRPSFSSKKGRPSANYQRLKRLIQSDYHLSSRALHSNDKSEDRGRDRNEHNPRLWLDTALVVLRSSGETPSSTLLPGLVRSMFSTPRMLLKESTAGRVTRDATYLSAELFNSILQVVWDYPPPHVYFSPSSQQIVTDYFWFEALAWGMVSNGGNGHDYNSNGHVNVNNNNFNSLGLHSGGDLNYPLHRKRNFRQDSLFPRMRIFQVVDELIVRVTRATHLLDALGGLSTSTTAVDAPASGSGLAGFRKGGGSGSSSRKGFSLSSQEITSTTTHFLTQLQTFLQQMHSVAIAFSHADYIDALSSAREAESTVLLMESALHTSELRAVVKQKNVFLGLEEGSVGVTCRDKHDYMYHYNDEEETDSPQSSSWSVALKRILTSSLVDYAAIFGGVVLGAGGVSGYMYRRSGAGRRTFYRG